MCLGIPGLVVEITDPDNQIAKVDVSGVRRKVHVGLVMDEGELEVGEWVLIHVGFAISRIDEEEARATLDLLQRLGDPYREELEELKGSRIT